eukprot:3314015-Rhodomonas_salina.1
MPYLPPNAAPGQSHFLRNQMQFPSIAIRIVPALSLFPLISQSGFPLVSLACCEIKYNYLLFPHSLYQNRYYSICFRGLTAFGQYHALDEIKCDFPLLPYALYQHKVLTRAMLLHALSVLNPAMRLQALAVPTSAMRLQALSVLTSAMRLHLLSVLTGYGLCAYTRGRLLNASLPPPHPVRHPLSVTHVTSHVICPRDLPRGRHPRDLPPS